ncbi:MAG: DUF5777 family beta-barrel protein [Luteibaculum sp.]
MVGKTTKAFLAALLLCGNLWGQEDLFDTLDEMQPEQENYATATFKSTRIVNSPTIELTRPGELNFIVQHRFGTINSGLYDLFGIDNSEVRLAFDYGLTPFLMVGIGRSGGIKTYDANAKVRLLRQKEGGSPVTLAAYTAVAYDFNKSRPGEELDDVNRLSYVYELLVARKFSESLSLQLAPAFVHKNLVDSASFGNDFIALGLGGRQKVSKRVSINLDYVYLLDNGNRDDIYNSIALGVDIETGGHVFSLHVTNSRGMADRSYITETTGDISDGDIYFGFNINRVFTVDKRKKAKGL